MGVGGVVRSANINERAAWFNNLGSLVELLYEEHFTINLSCQYWLRIRS